MPSADFHRALGALGCEVRVLLPCYPGVAERVQQRQTIAAFDDLFGGPATLARAQIDDGPPFVLVDAPHLYGRPGNPYLGPDGEDHADNHFRFAALCRAAARARHGRPRTAGKSMWCTAMTGRPGWPSAYLPSSATPASPPSIFTIHNHRFCWAVSGELRSAPPLGLPNSLFHPEGLANHYGQISFLKAGLILLPIGSRR